MHIYKVFRTFKKGILLGGFHLSKFSAYLLVYCIDVISLPSIGRKNLLLGQNRLACAVALSEAISCNYLRLVLLRFPDEFKGSRHLRRLPYFSLSHFQSISNSTGVVPECSMIVEEVNFVDELNWTMTVRGCKTCQYFAHLTD